MLHVGPPLTSFPAGVQTYSHKKKGLPVPWKSKHPCSAPWCPNLTDSRYCEAHRKETEKQYRTYERDPEINKRYDSRWRKIRNQHIREHPLCVHCFEKGRMTAAQEVHHIRPLAHGGTHAPENLQSLCKPCHSRQTAKDGDRWRRKKPTVYTF